MLRGRRAHVRRGQPLAAGCPAGQPGAAGVHDHGVLRCNQVTAAWIGWEKSRGAGEARGHSRAGGARNGSSGGGGRTCSRLSGSRATRCRAASPAPTITSSHRCSACTGRPRGRRGGREARAAPRQLCARAETACTDRGAPAARPSRLRRRREWGACPSVPLLSAADSQAHTGSKIEPIVQRTRPASCARPAAAAARQAAALPRPCACQPLHRCSACHRWSRACQQQPCSCEQSVLLAPAHCASPHTGAGSEPRAPF